MQYRPLGRTGISVSHLTLGGMMFGAMGNSDRDERVAIVHRARGSPRPWRGALRRLRTDHLDVDELGAPDANTDVDETLAVLTDLVAASKIRSFGPLAGGWPSGRYRSGQVSTTSGPRSHGASMDATNPADAAELAAADALGALAEDADLTLAQLATAWAARQPR